MAFERLQKIFRLRKKFSDAFIHLATEAKEVAARLPPVPREDIACIIRRQSSVASWISWFQG
jgi:hypothetical protein